jgi:hypothetical protein
MTTADPYDTVGSISGTGWPHPASDYPAEQFHRVCDLISMEGADRVHYSAVCVDEKNVAMAAFTKNRVEFIDIPAEHAKVQVVQELMHATLLAMVAHNPQFSSEELVLMVGASDHAALFKAAGLPLHRDDDEYIVLSAQHIYDLRVEYAELMRLTPFDV